MDRRKFLKLAAASGGAALFDSAGLGPQTASGQVPPPPAEPMPVSPLILRPFRDRLPVPKPLAPSDPSEWRNPEGGPADPPNPDKHQDWSLGPPSVFYNIKIAYTRHRFTTSPVRGRDGRPTSLPESWMSTFNGTFPGSMIKAVYGQPCLVRFENCMNPDDLPSGMLNDFGVPSFLTHLHNGHTAPESDGNPFHTHGVMVDGKPMDGYDSWYGGPNGQWYLDNLYLNMPAGNDDREKQSFMWFHDHRMDNTGSNVYKGMVGLYPIYDPILDPGDETQGLRLPGVPQADGSVLYDIPLGLYDCCFDDGVTPHMGLNVGSSLDFGVLQDGRPHPENWGRLFFAHYENLGFVGDVFTVNGIAYPYLPVKRRKYRLRFLDCSIARQYELKLMKGTPRVKPGLQGQYELTGSRQCMRFVQIATEGGLMPQPLFRDSIGLWPAKRREVIVDFSKYMDGSPTKNGDVIYLTNIASMLTGRKRDGTLSNGVPLMQFIIDGNPPQPDLSVIPATMRERPPLPSQGHLAGLTHRTFELKRGGGNWLINGAPFDPEFSFADIPHGAEEVWTIVNGGGGWTHPLHIHQEEHRVLSRNGLTPPAADNNGKEDVVALAENESVQIYRRFRTFRGRYVCHCHSLAHEDHAMMFGWQIV
jgi:FtsP/CotA-like multicopper oxidase with cupredoxin domain